MTFYDRLSELCRREGTSITAFALEAGCNRSTPNGWKRGSSPSADIVARAARRFDVTTDYLLGLSEAVEHVGEGLTVDELTLLRAYRAADPLLRRAALSVLQTDGGQCPQPIATALERSEPAPSW